LSLEGRISDANRRYFGAPTRCQTCPHGEFWGLPRHGVDFAVVELLRTRRPLTLFWSMAALQLVLWTLVPFVFYAAPPGQLPAGAGDRPRLPARPPTSARRWRSGLAELTYRVMGMLGVYLLSQICIVVTFWAVLALGRAVVGEVHAVMAVLLMAGVAVFSVPTPEFGPAILAAPLWALLLYHYWQAAKEGDWRYWLAAGIDAGLLLLTTYAGLILLGLVVMFLLSSRVGRSHLETVGPWIAGVVTVVILFPYLIWLDTRRRHHADRLGRHRAEPAHLGLAGRGADRQPCRARHLDHSWPRLSVSRRAASRRRCSASRSIPAPRCSCISSRSPPILAMALFALISHRRGKLHGRARLAVMSGLAMVVAGRRPHPRRASIRDRLCLGPR